MKRATLLFVLVVIGLSLIAPTARAVKPIVPPPESTHCGGQYHFYLPLVAQAGNDMIISKFGSTWAGAYQFSTLKGKDDWQIMRPAVAGQVGGMSGAFDFHGSDANPIAPQTVIKTFELVVPEYTYTGAGTMYTHDAGPGPDVWAIFGIDTTFTTDFSVNDQIGFTFGGTDYIFTIGHITSDTQMEVISAEEDALLLIDCQSASAVAYTVIKTNAYANIDRAIEDLKAAVVYPGEGKLWGLRRDGTYRWAWAKFVRGKFPEDYTTKLHLPVELEFYLREGLWYGDQWTRSRSEANPATFDITYNGAVKTGIHYTISSNVGTLTSVTVTNNTNGDTFTWTGSLAVGQLLIVDSNTFTVTKAGADAYSGLTYGATQASWFSLDPGVNSVTVTVTGSTDWGCDFLYTETFL